MTIYILSYNSYFNRIVKKYDSLKEYGNYIIHSESQLNFNPGDGCDTTFVAGRQGNPYDGSGNYLIYSEDNVSITSRWFIIDQTRNLKGQYTLTLHRDVVVDSYNDVMNADMVVESAIIPDTNPLIYNAEPLSVNQIKVDEQPLKDKTGCPWIVGYFDKRKYLDITTQRELEYDVSVNMPFETWRTELSSMKAPTDESLIISAYSVKSVGPGVPQEYYEGVYTISNINGQSDNITYKKIGSANEDYSFYKRTFSDDTIFPEAWNLRTQIEENNVFQNLKNNYSLNKSANYDDYLGFNNKTVRFKEADGNYSYYKLYTYQLISYSMEIVNRSVAESVQLTKSMESLDFNVISSDISCVVYMQNFNTIQLSNYTKIDPGTFTGIINEGASYNYSSADTSAGYWTKKLATDAPYGIFAIPYGEVTINDNKTEKDVAMLYAQEAYRRAGGTSGGTFIYDLQLLPYCPCPEWVDDDGKISLKNENYYNLIKDGDKIKSYIIYPQSQTFTLNINHKINLDNIKINTTCNIYRLCSPNYNGQFEFNAAKNGGVNYFNVDCTYKPYNPYIHINPDFKELYGSDFNDCRGLICNGEFSLPVMNDAWIAYENTNKNYQNIFDRQIQNMDTNRSIQRKQETVAIYTNALTAVGSGGLGGKMLSGGSTVGSIVGGIIGAGASIAGGYADRNFSDQLYKESVSFAKDNWNMSLDNIQALAQSVGKTTSFTANNKIFPIIEYYSCTEAEKEFVANKIALNSMSVGVPGKPKEYVTNKWSYNNIESKGFFKGKLLHADIEQDSHYLTTLAHELELGGYFTWE